jgi:ribonucleoside-diphosphate reductase beta chain
MTIINDPNFDPNKALPMTSLWAWEYYKKGIANSWVPEEVDMKKSGDIEQWKSKDSLSPQERKMVSLNLGFFSTAESLTANNLIAISKHITDFQCLQYITRQLWEEAIHTHTFIYCCDSFLSSEEVDEVYKMYKTLPSVKEKDDFVTELTKSVLDPNFTTEGEENIRLFLLNLVGYYVIMEGIFFYAGFAMMLNLGRRGKMKGVAKEFDLILKDEGLHVGFGCDLINAIKGENQQVWTPEFQKEIIEKIKKAVELEKKYSREACPEKILGINSQQYCQYIEYIANRRLEQIGLSKIYLNEEKEEVENPLDWMSEKIDLNKKGNFFETTITEYQTGSLKWDEEDEDKVKNS